MNSPLLALDIGLKHTGVALSESGLLSQPLTTIDWQQPHSHVLVQEVIRLLKEYDVKTLVVGIPFGEEEEPTSQALKTEHIVSKIEAGVTEAGLSVDVVRTNEFGSTQDAASRYPNTNKDAAAAALLLQDYLEQHGRGW